MMTNPKQDDLVILKPMLFPPLNDCNKGWNGKQNLEDPSHS